MGDLAEAERQWKEYPRGARYRQGWRGLGEALIQEQKLAEAEKLAAELMNDGALRAEGIFSLRAVWRRRRTGRTMRVRCSSRRMQEFPGDLETLRERCQFLFHHRAAEDAEQALRAVLIARDATCTTRTTTWGRFSCGVGATMRRSRPTGRRCDTGRNYVSLVTSTSRHVLKESGRLAEAAAVWEQAAAAGRASESGAFRR